MLRLESIAWIAILLMVLNHSLVPTGGVKYSRFLLHEQSTKKCNYRMLYTVSCLSS